MNLDRRRFLGAAAAGATLGAGALAAAGGQDGSKTLRVVLISGSAEYQSDESLASFQRYLEERFPATCVLLKARGTNDLPGLDVLDSCAAALFFTRRLTLPEEQLELIKAYCSRGRPIVAVRTASHGFENWLAFDKHILGGNYEGHCAAGPTQTAAITPAAAKHPAVAGVGTIRSRGSQYRTAPLARDCELLLTSTASGHAEPAAWTRSAGTCRVFYTSLGTPSDFENASFRRMIANALYWTARREIPVPRPPSFVEPPRAAGSIRVPLRSRIRMFKGSDEWNETTFTREFRTSECAIIICDMWDKHWCDGANTRCDAIAHAMNPLVEAARSRGVRIIHAPSETMDFYADRPQRLRMATAPRVARSPLFDIKEGALPIDDSDGGCDTDQPTQPYASWTRQHAAISIGEFDGISDNGDEVYSFLRGQGITTVFMMGVHTNMCVLGRTFAIRSLTRSGIRCVLVRDLTDAMYDPRDRPHVSHEAGTALVVEHIEKYWAPSTTKRGFMAGLKG